MYEWLTSQFKQENPLISSLITFMVLWVLLIQSPQSTTDSLKYKFWWPTNQKFVFQLVGFEQNISGFPAHTCRDSETSQIIWFGSQIISSVEFCPCMVLKFLLLCQREMICGYVLACCTFVFSCPYLHISTIPGINAVVVGSVAGLVFL